MNIRSLFLGLLLTSVACLAEPPSASDSTETNAAPAAPVAAATPPAMLAELEDLRSKLDSIQRANENVTGKWQDLVTQSAVLVEQNASLSNVLVGLQETLVNQRKREIELGEEARAFNTKVMLGAAGGMFLVFLASYWFQLRCMNRVMDLSRSQPALQAPYAPPLLDAPSAAESRLLEAVKLLESRIRQLEGPAAAATTSTATANGASMENGHSIPAEMKIVDAGAMELQPADEKVSVLLAKGEILLDMERLPEALASFQEALGMDPNNAEAHLKKGITLERMNRLEQSLSSYDEALRLNPKRAFAYVHKARVLAALHRYDEALSVYDVAMGKNTAKAAMTTAGNAAR